MLGVKTKIKKYLHTTLGFFDEPSTIRINPVGFVCNHACPMCWRLQISPQERNTYIQNEVKHLTIHEYRNLFASLPKSVNYIDVVSGGEPLLYPHIEDLFTLIKQKNIYGRLVTNGSLLTPRMIHTLIEHHWDEIRISMHSCSADVYKKVNGADDFNRVVSNINTIVKTRGEKRFPIITLMSVIQNINYKEIRDFTKMAENMGVDGIEFDYLIPFRIPRLFLDDKQKAYVVETLSDVRKTLHIKHNIDYVLRMFENHPLWRNEKGHDDYYNDKYCQQVQSSMEISCLGDASPCCMCYAQEKFGNIRNNSLSTIWKRSRSFRKRLSEGKFEPFCYELCNYEMASRTQ